MSNGLSKFQQSVQQLDVATRIRRAKDLIEHKVINHVLEVVAIDANNEYVVYSNQLTSQIPRSFAGHAYKALSQSLLFYCVLRTVSLWDRAEENADNICTAIEYIDSEDVLDAIAEEHRAKHKGLRPRSLDPVEDENLRATVDAMVRESQGKYAADQAKKAKRRLKATIRYVRSVAASSEMERIRNLRDKHIAHRLTATYRERRRTIDPARVGEERKLLEQSILVAENLYCWVNGTSFDIQDDYRKIADKRARQLWESVSIDSSNW